MFEFLLEMFESLFEFLSLTLRTSPNMKQFCPHIFDLYELNSIGLLSKGLKFWKNLICNLLLSFIALFLFVNNRKFLCFFLASK